MPDPKSAIASRSPSLALTRSLEFFRCVCGWNIHTHFMENFTINEHEIHIHTYKHTERQRWSLCRVFLLLYTTHTHFHIQSKSEMDECRYYYTYSWCCCILRCLNNNNGEFATLDIHSHSQQPNTLEYKRHKYTVNWVAGWLADWLASNQPSTHTNRHIYIHILSLSLLCWKILRVKKNSSTNIVFFLDSILYSPFSFIFLGFCTKNHPPIRINIWMHVK